MTPRHLWRAVCLALVGNAAYVAVDRLGLEPGLVAAAPMALAWLLLYFLGIAAAAAFTHMKQRVMPRPPAP